MQRVINCFKSWIVKFAHLMPKNGQNVKCERKRKKGQSTKNKWTYLIKKIFIYKYKMFKLILIFNIINVYIQIINVSTVIIVRVPGIKIPVFFA